MNHKYPLDIRIKNFFRSSSFLLFYAKAFLDRKSISDALQFSIVMTKVYINYESSIDMIKKGLKP